MPAFTAAHAYRIVSVYLAKNADKEKTAKQAIKKHSKELTKLLGEPYADYVDTIIDAYYDIEKYVSDDEPMEKFYEYLDDLI